ncbi:MAG: PEP/pyruvate-binding domain-containing protein [Gammaproteobacteria bacterium]
MASANAEDAARYRADIAAMKAQPRGPFSRIRWFCSDGEVLPPKAYACVDHGGGRQHGEWSDATKRIRAAGFPIGNVLAALGPEDFGDTPEQQRLFRIMVLEQYLIDMDDGWILRGARYYRGAFQIEEEEASAYEFLSTLARQPEWLQRRFLLLVEAARLVPHGQSGVGGMEIRGMATALNDADQDFGDLRNKIHGRPEPSDAARVRAYAASRGKSELADKYEALAQAIDEAARLPDPSPLIEAYARKVRDNGLAVDLRLQARELAVATAPAERIEILSRIMARLRDGIDSSGHPLDGIDLLIRLETQVFGLAQLIDADSGSLTREQTLGLMKATARASYGTGLLTRFELDNLEGGMAGLARSEVPLSEYRSELAYLGRAPGWASRRLAFYFEQPIAWLAQIEPLAETFIPDRMRGSPMMVYSRLLNPLVVDAMRLAGVRQQIFGETVGTGLRSLNPGVGRGTLLTLEQALARPGGTADTIVIVPETISELPVVAGIITENEGNALSHVQLLARNLGVPNVVVANPLLPRLQQHLGQEIFVAASRGGVVQIRLDEDAPVATAEDHGAEEKISINVARLDLETQRLLPSTELGPKDSGVRVGPKAAEVGNLNRKFPGHVSPAVAVPFGLFSHALTERTVSPDGPTLFEWMTVQYDQIDAIDDPIERDRRAREMLATVRGWFKTLPPDPQKLAAFRQSLRDNFGPDGSYGVFVRSDTNVEDLAGFTGAGLNLTVPNVVGEDNIVAAMRDVWASPFQERAYGWRQSIMNDPEHVYVSVLLHESVNADKSGVLITADVETGSRDFITVAVNEGVGGGVEGQAAETLLIRRADGQVRLLGSATAPAKRVLKTSGGSELVPASGASRVLTDANVEQILALVDRLPGWFENMPEEERSKAVADVEFGFLDGKLYLFQIRPFVENKRAARSTYLQSLDAGLAQNATQTVWMDQKPGSDQGSGAEL